MKAEVKNYFIFASSASRNSLLVFPGPNIFSLSRRETSTICSFTCESIESRSFSSSLFPHSSIARA